MTVDFQPTATLPSLRARAALFAQLRAFFAARDVLEVDTPLLCGATATDPYLESFCVPLGGAGDTDSAAFLQTSPEFAMKRLLAAGSGDIYQLGKAFRVDEQGQRHNPEFTLLEWYRVGWDRRQLQQEVLALLSEVAEQFQQAWPVVAEYRYTALFQEYFGLHPLEAPDAQLKAAAETFLTQHGDGGSVVLPDVTALDRWGWLDLLMASCIEPHLPAGIVIVTDFPAQQAALAKTRTDADGWAVAERFEVYLNGVELANGYQELTDAAEQRRRFAADNTIRGSLGLPQLPTPEHLLAALESGLPESAGVALGVDRLLMAALQQESLSQVLPFAFERA